MQSHTHIMPLVDGSFVRIIATLCDCDVEHVHFVLPRDASEIERVTFEITAMLYGGMSVAQDDAGRSVAFARLAEHITDAGWLGDVLPTLRDERAERAARDARYVVDDSVSAHATQDDYDTQDERTRTRPAVRTPHVHRPRITHDDTQDDTFLNN